MIIPISQRIQNVSEYYFSKKLKEIKYRNDAGENIINLGIGSPDLLPPANVIRTLQKAAEEKAANQYQSYIGIDELRIEISNWYNTFFDVKLNPANEILPLLGSKEGIMHITQAFTNVGDKVLIPNPGYPTYQAVSNLAQNEIINYDLDPKQNWMPDLKKLQKLPLNEVKILWINYQNMPTGAKGDPQIMQELIDLALKHQFLIVNDNPYSFILNDKPISIMQLNHAQQCCLELNSLSKLYNLAGWRVGMLVGHKNYIEAVLKVKSNMDSGMYYPIQKGAAEALRQPKEWFIDLNVQYQKRREIIHKVADILQLNYDVNNVGMFVWAKITTGEKSEVFCDKYLNQAQVFITPGTIFGSNGEGYVRFSLCNDEAILTQVLDRIINLKNNSK